MSSVANPYDRVEFDFSIDEAVALQADFVKSTREGRSWRTREQRNFVVAAIVVATSVVILKSAPGSLVLVAVVLGVITPIALVLAVPFGWYYDYVVRRRMRRLLLERWGAGPHHCAIEIHSDELRVAQAGTRLEFAWSSGVETGDGPDGVVISFTSGRVLARSRGFISLQHRQHFARHVSTLVRLAKLPSVP